MKLSLFRDGGPTWSQCPCVGAVMRCWIVCMWTRGPRRSRGKLAKQNCPILSEFVFVFRTRHTAAFHQVVWGAEGEFIYVYQCKCHWCIARAMLRFLSRRRNRHTPMGPGSDPHGAPAHQQLKDKNILPCRIILLDGTDLSVDLSVRFFILYCHSGGHSNDDDNNKNCVGTILDLMIYLAFTWLGVLFTFSCLRVVVVVVVDDDNMYCWSAAVVLQWIIEFQSGTE